MAKQFPVKLVYFEKHCWANLINILHTSNQIFIPQLTNSSEKLGKNC